MTGAPPSIACEPDTPEDSPGPAPARAPAGRSGWRSPLVLGAIGLLGLILIVEVVPRVGILPRRFLPPSSEIGSALVDQFGQQGFWIALADTIEGWALGLFLAAVTGIIVGLGIGSSHFLRQLTASTIEFLRPIPSVALIPLAVLLFGTSLESKLLLVVYASFWPMLIQVLYGVQDVDPVAQETARAYRFGFWARMRYVTWPTALPYLMTGLRLSAAVALILAVTAELVIGIPGLGHRLAIAQSSGAIPATYALVVVAGIIGVVVNLLTRFVERRALNWHPAQRAEAL